MVNVLFVCTGNICRSSMAEGLFRDALRGEKLEHCINCDSAGLIDYHADSPPDHRAQRQLLKYGVDISSQLSRPVSREDLSEFDYIIAMDSGHFDALQRLGNEFTRSRISLMMDYSPHAEMPEVPDPYYGDTAGFEEVAEMLKPAVRGLIRAIRSAR